MPTPLLNIAYPLILKNGLRGRGALLRIAAFFRKEITLTFSGGLSRQIDLARHEEAIPFLDFYYGTNIHLDALFQTIERAYTPGQVLWDIGGNLGMVSLYFTRPPFRFQAIHLFEPNPELFQGLSELFQHSHVEIHRVGLGDKDESLHLNIPEGGHSCGSLVHQHAQPSHVQEVSIRHGDTYLKESGIPAPDIIKIDVEGFEANVLQGLQETITIHRPIIVLEHLFIETEEFLSLIPEGYVHFLICDSGELTPDFASRRHEGHNSVFTPREKAALFDSSSSPTTSKNPQIAPPR